MTNNIRVDNPQTLADKICSLKDFIEELSPETRVIVFSLTARTDFSRCHSFIPTFDFFFQIDAFCTEFNLFTPICFVLLMIMDLPYICDDQVGYSAGGYSLSPRWFLTWYIYPFFQD